MSDDDGDDDEPAMTEGMEAEVTPETVAAGGDDEGGGDDEHGLPADTQQAATFIEGRRGHPKSAKVKQLLAEAVASLKAQKDAGELDEDGLEVDYDEEPSERQQAARQESPPTPTPGQAVTPANVAPPAPIPALDPKHLADAEAVRARGLELDERERSLTEREKSADLRAFRDTWIEKGPIEALRSLLKAQGIAENDEDWKDEAAELITDLSEKTFGTKIDPTMRNTIDVRRAKRAIAANRKALTDREQALDRQKLEQAHKADWEAARGGLARELAKDQHRNAYPFLASLDNAPQIVMEWAQKESDAGRSISWQEAAKAANDYIQDQAVKQTERWRPLLEKRSKAQPNGKPVAPGRPPGTSQVIATQQIPPTPPPQKPAPTPVTNGRNWNEQHRRNTKRAMRAAFRTEE